MEATVPSTASLTTKPARWLMAVPCLMLFLALGLVFAHLSEEVVQNPLLMVLAACVLVSFLVFPEGPIGGPLTPLWKLINGLSLFYLLGLVYLFFQTRQKAIQDITTYVDPGLKLLNYQEVSYAQDCRIIHPQKQNPFESLYHACFDLFALAHFLGWFFKTLICRDLKLILFASVSFQMIEFSLRNVLNNFKECWWDHIIIDIFGCNLLGIICGFIVIDQLGLDRYRWSLRSAPLQYSHWENFKRFWTSLDLSYLETKAFASLRPFLKMALFIIMFQINDLSLFFLKYVYHIPPAHFLCVGRVWVMGLLTVNTVREYYDFMKHRAKFRKLTIMLFASILIMEMMIVATQGQNLFDHAYIDTTGQILLGILVTIFVVFFIKIAVSDIIRKFRGYKAKKQAKSPKVMHEHAKPIKACDH